MLFISSFGWWPLVPWLHWNVQLSLASSSRHRRMSNFFFIPIRVPRRDHRVRIVYSAFVWCDSSSTRRVDTDPRLCLITGIFLFVCFFFRYYSLFSPFYSFNSFSVSGKCKYILCCICLYARAYDDVHKASTSEWEWGKKMMERILRVWRDHTRAIK